MRLTPFLFLATVLSGHSQILFKDTFDRADSRNIDSALTGVTDRTGAPLAADNFYQHGHIDPNNNAPTYGIQDADAANGGGVQILSNRLQLAVGAGTSNLFVNHNFTNAAITETGGFSVSLEVTGYTQTARQQGGGFAIGMSQAEAQSAEDAFNLTAPMTGAFNDASSIGAAVPGAVVSDFWVALRGNNSLAWGGSSGVIGGTSGFAARTGTITVNFAVTDFNAGSTVAYEVFLNGVTQGTGSFIWSGTNENFIGIDARDSTAVGFDNFSVSTFAPTPAVVLDVTSKTVPSDVTAQTVTLSWNSSGLPDDATYEITADQVVSFPAGGNAGAAVNGPATVEAVVNGALGSTTFAGRIFDAESAVVATDTAIVTQVPPARPNVVVILVDDLGWGDLGCYGSEIPTPNIDALGVTGARFRQFYQSARCSPTRCSILTGLYPQQAAVNPAEALPDLRNDNNVTFAEMLGSQGYRTYMAGKWHLGSGALLPENRGFQHVWRFNNGQAHSNDQWNQNAYTLISGEIGLNNYTANGQQFYQTDAIGDYAVDYIDHSLGKGDGAPFAMYLAFGAPHFPIQAPAAEADAFMSTYAQGWDVVRQNRYNRQLEIGVIDTRYPFPGLGGTGPHAGEAVVAIPAWETLPATRKADLTRRMALYAAMIKKIDDNVGKIVARLQTADQLDNTLIMFMSDNGGNHEGGIYGNDGAAPLTGTALTNMGQPGAGDGIHYGGGLAHLSNTPLKLFKHFTHEGGVRAPLIVHWPDGFSARDTWVETPVHLIDVMGSIVDATGAAYPATFNSHPVLPLEGTSLIPLIDGGNGRERSIFVEHESNRMVRKGKWKLVTEAFSAFDGEFSAHERLLYDMDADPGESVNLASQQPAKVVELVDEWNAWATRVGLPAGRLLVPPPVSITPPQLPVDLFFDSFNRQNAVDTDISSSGISGSRVPPIGANAAWYEGFEGSGANSSIQIEDGILRMAVGVGMSENGVRHNFIGQDILDGGGFSVSLKILQINSITDDAINRFAGFGVGLTEAEAAAGNDLSGTNPRPIRGSTTNPGSADCFLDLDLNGNVKLWSGGILRATVPVGKVAGTLTASFKVSNFASGSTVTVSAYLDGQLLDLSPAAAGTTATFTWSQSNSNYVALSARASSEVLLDNFAVRRLPLSSALVVDYALQRGLEGEAGGLASNTDGDGLNNLGEWAFGTDPTKMDDELASTSILLESGVARFAHRRLEGAPNDGSLYHYFVSGDLNDWEEIYPTQESASPLVNSPGYEVVTLMVPETVTTGKSRLFLRVVASDQ